MTEKTMWKMDWSKPGGKKVTVVKETELFVTYLDSDWRDNPYECRAKKDGNFFPSFDAMKDYLVGRAEKQLISAQDRVVGAEKHLEAMRNLTEEEK